MKCNRRNIYKKNLTKPKIEPKKNMYIIVNRNIKGKG